MHTHVYTYAHICMHVHTHTHRSYYYEKVIPASEFTDRKQEDIHLDRIKPNLRAVVRRSLRGKMDNFSREKR